MWFVFSIFPLFSFFHFFNFFFFNFSFFSTFFFENLLFTCNCTSTVGTDIAATVSEARLTSIRQSNSINFGIEHWFATPDCLCVWVIVYLFVCVSVCVFFQVPNFILLKEANNSSYFILIILYFNVVFHRIHIFSISKFFSHLFVFLLACLHCCKFAPIICKIKFFKSGWKDCGKSGPKSAVFSYTAICNK